MSGEAYNGSHVADIGDLIARRANLGDLEHLHSDLKATPGCESLADAVLGIILRVREQRRVAEAIQKSFDSLYAPLHDFTWWQSADSSEDHFRETLRQWKAERL